MKQAARLLIITGSILVFSGLIIYLVPGFSKIPRLPGDIFIKGRNFSFYFPVTTSIIFSILVSLFLWFISKK